MIVSGGRRPSEVFRPATLAVKREPPGLAAVADAICKQRTHDTSDGRMVNQTWTLLKESISSFLQDEALTRGAAIAFYTVTSIGPVLFIVMAIAGLVFGEEAASGAVYRSTERINGSTECGVAPNSNPERFWQVVGLLGDPPWRHCAHNHRIRRVHGDAADLERDLEGQPQGSTVSALLRARATSLGLVAALGFLLLVSLVISTILTALSTTSSTRCFRRVHLISKHSTSSLRLF